MVRRSNGRPAPTSALPARTWGPSPMAAFCRPATPTGLAPGAVLSFQAARSGARAYWRSRAGLRWPRCLAPARPTIGPASAALTDDRCGPAMSCDSPGARTGRCARSSVRCRRRRATRLHPDRGKPGWLSPAAARAFCATEWQVAPDSDRNGIRLTGGTPLPRRRPAIAQPRGPGRLGPGAAQRGPDHQDGRWPGHRWISGAGRDP